MEILNIDNRPEGTTHVDLDHVNSGFAASEAWEKHVDGSVFYWQDNKWHNLFDPSSSLDESVEIGAFLNPTDSETNQSMSVSIKKVAIIDQKTFSVEQVDSVIINGVEFTKVTKGE